MLFRFTFSFGLEPGQKVLPLEMAASLWQLVFSPLKPPLLTRYSITIICFLFYL